MEGKGMYREALWEPGTMPWDEIERTPPCQVHRGMAKEYNVTRAGYLVAEYGMTPGAAVERANQEVPEHARLPPDVLLDNHRGASKSGGYLATHKGKLDKARANYQWAHEEGERLAGRLQPDLEELLWTWDAPEDM